MFAARFLFVASLLLAVPAAVQAGETTSLEVDAAWIRAAPPSAAVMAGYVRIVNRGGEEAVIASFASDAFGAVELHEMSHVDGVMRMRSLPELRIAPGDSVTLAPGGMHLMLMRPARPLSAGESVDIEFVTKNGRRERVAFDVRAAAPR